MSVTVYRFGLCHCSVCAPKNMLREQVETETDLAHPTGLDHGWKISGDETFKGGETNPCRCDQDGERLHYLMVC
jgi:hypothetical protein